MDELSPPQTQPSSSLENLSLSGAIDGSPSSESAGEPTESPSQQSSSIAERSPDGKFLPGKSGNPAGLPKGTKQKNRELKDKLELASREYIKPADLRRVWDAIIASAVDGSVGAQKLVLEYTMSKVSDIMEKDKEEGPREYVFYVVDSRAAGEKEVSPTPIEGEFQSTQE